MPCQNKELFLLPVKSIQKTEQKDATSYVPQFYYLICNWCLKWLKILVFIIITLLIPNSGVCEMIGFNTHQANLFNLLIWDGSNFVCVCVLFLGKFLHCDNKEKWEIAKNSENFTKLSKAQNFKSKKEPCSECHVTSNYCKCGSGSITSLTRQIQNWLCHSIPSSCFTKHIVL